MARASRPDGPRATRPGRHGALARVVHDRPRHPRRGLGAQDAHQPVVRSRRREARSFDVQPARGCSAHTWPAELRMRDQAAGHRRDRSSRAKAARGLSFSMRFAEGSPVFRAGRVQTSLMVAFSDFASALRARQAAASASISSAETTSRHWPPRCPPPPDGETMHRARPLPPPPAAAHSRACGRVGAARRSGLEPRRHS